MLAKDDDMNLGLDRLLSLENACSLGEELAGAADDVLQANRARLQTLELAIVGCEQARQQVDHAQLVAPPLARSCVDANRRLTAAHGIWRDTSAADLCIKRAEQNWVYPRPASSSLRRPGRG